MAEDWVNKKYEYFMPLLGKLYLERHLTYLSIFLALIYPTFYYNFKVR